MNDKESPNCDYSTGYVILYFSQYISFFPARVFLALISCTTNVIFFFHLSTNLGIRICNSGSLPIFRSKFVWIYTNLIFAIPLAAYLLAGSLDTRDTFSSD